MLIFLGNQIRMEDKGRRRMREEAGGSVEDREAGGTWRLGLEDVGQV